MNVFTKLSAQRAARVDARAGVDSIEARVTGELGLRPTLDPTKNPEHAEFVRTLAARSRMDELRDDLARAEEEASKVSSPALLALGIVFFLAVEVWGSFAVMRVLGVSPADRILLGIGLAIAVVGATAVMARRATGAPDAGSPEGSAGARIVRAAARTLWTTFALATYSIIIAALAVVRIVNAADDSAPILARIGQGVVLLATTVAPAWALEAFFRGRKAASDRVKHARALRRQFREAERARRRAQDEVHRIARLGAEWDDRAARLRSVYAVEHRLEARKGENE